MTNDSYKVFLRVAFLHWSCTSANSAHYRIGLVRIFHYHDNFQKIRTKSHCSHIILSHLYIRKIGAKLLLDFKIINMSKKNTTSKTT